MFFSVCLRKSSSRYGEFGKELSDKRGDNDSLRFIVPENVCIKIHYEICGSSRTSVSMGVVYSWAPSSIYEHNFFLAEGPFLRQLIMKI